MTILTHRKPSTIIAAGLLIIIAVAHLVRVFYNISVTVNTVTIPVWPSILAVIVTGGLAIWLWTENKE
jgi:hypothetical protein